LVCVNERLKLKTIYETIVFQALGTFSYKIKQLETIFKIGRHTPFKGYNEYMNNKFYL